MGHFDRGYDISTLARLMLPDDLEQETIGLRDVLDGDPEHPEPIFYTETPARATLHLVKSEPDEGRDRAAA